MKRLVLIDGSSYLYRAFHALPPLTNAQGEPTGALFGVVNMLRATLKEKPDYVAFVIDAPGKTFRDELYPEYKANRPPMPDELRAQVQPMCEVVEALGIDILRVDGVEADDVIGTLALAGAAEGLDVTVSTSDKDFAQLVRPGITLVNTMSGSRMDSDEAITEKYGVPPELIIDMMALVGDAVDNVPGVPKCGPKTAAKWLGQYGSLDGIIANADGIKGKVGDNLREALPQLPLYRELVRIRTDLELERGPAGLPLRARDVENLRALYTRYGFTQALRDLDTGSGEAGAAEVPAPAAQT
ncbi:MAG: 5'-3' exonuclease, partial [Luteimonas sp.]